MSNLNENVVNAAAATRQNDARNKDAGQRDEKGRFGKGNRGGPGNPFIRR